MQIWTYVITHDHGSAPNYEGRYTTLAICKPLIRRSAKRGDLIIAFSGARTKTKNPHSVCWAGIVSEAMPIATYWNDPRFAHKKPDRSKVPDNIYKPNAQNNLVWVDNEIHTSNQIARDTGGINVLVFKERWYFGANGPEIPEPFGLRMSPHSRRGHRRYDDRDTDLPKLKKWFDAQKETKPPTSGTVSKHCGPQCSCTIDKCSPARAPHKNGC